jgi:ATP-dependent RNA helicase SUPV3L1/SUV3
VAEVNDKGEVSVEGHFVGRIDGFRFTVDETAQSEESKTLRTASLAALQAEFARRADKLYVSPDPEIEVTEQGGLMWGADAVGRLEKGDSPLAPRIRVFVDENADAAVAEKVERRLSHWITRRINTLFEPLLTMRDDEAVTGLARGVAFQIAEAMGVVQRRQVADDVKALGQEERALLRKHGVRFGQYNIFMPLLLKPAPTRLRLTLWSLWEGFEVFAEAPPPGLVTIPALADAPRGYYERVGFRLCGSRALRIDMLERLADLIRPMDVRAGFEATPDMLSITGCTLDQIAEILKSLGFDGQRGERPKPVRPAQAESPVSGKTAGETAPEAVEAKVEDTPQDGADAAVVEAPAETEAAGSEPAVAEVQPEPTEPEAAAVPEPEPEPGQKAGFGEVTEAGEQETSETEAGETEVEVYYTFKLRPRQRPGQGGPRHRRSDGDASGGASADPSGRGAGRSGGRRDKKPGGKQGAADPGKGGPKGKGPRRNRDGRAGHDNTAPKPDRPHREEKPLDPLSPFAILQQLKDK